MDSKDNKDTTKNENNDFIKEVVKEKKSIKNNPVFKITMVLVTAAAAAFIAAFVFTMTLPLAKNVAGTGDGSSKKINIPEDEQMDSQTESSSLPEKQDESSNEDVQEVPVVVDPAFNIEDYKNLYSDMNEITEEAKRSIVKVTGVTSSTDYFDQILENEKSLSGVIIGSNNSSYFILSDYSILSNVERIQVELFNGKVVNGIFQKYDPETNLAVIKINISDIDEDTKKELKPASLGNSLVVNQGDPVIAIGSRNEASDYISYGMITSTSEKLSVYDKEYTIFDTNITNSKSENGILLNLSGEVEGIIKRSDDATISAYSVSQIKNMIEKLSNNEDRAFLGIKGSDVSASLSEKTGIPRGILVVEVKPDSPAMLSGIMENDVIIGIDNQDILTMLAFQTIMRQYNSGTNSRVRVMRKGAQGYTEVEFNIQLGEI